MGVGVYDPQCGLKLFQYDIAHILLSRIETSEFEFHCEVIVKALTLGLTIKEIPIIWEHDYGSKVRILHDIVAMGGDLLSVWYKNKIVNC
jgi:dolichyl-phosphate beta-glucosyltransferase